MSINLTLKRASSTDIARLHETPAAIHAFLEKGRPARSAEYLAKQASIARQLDLPPEPPRVEIPFDVYPFDDEFKAFKLWHGLHFMLSGDPDGGDLPAASLLGDEPIGEEDVGYGPANALSVSQTADFTRFLDALDRAAFLERLIPAKMRENDIYPDIWDEDLDDLKAEFGDVFDSLRAYCRKCTDHGLGMICAMT
ncbi:hypothetical protein ABAC460_05640 [Asticcacaulis sp. AC460]|uniref:YfbM family protein n=1 Tax=Asticcacaulis sp. AC460 TaxID=1282360 RepID=UPI0003C3FAE2|nr:YfbM family protein [Asticcacaulis sp. AC460]ESQ91465.1 hypothetical protein ABAC460_05640 [Asticcacaulis sp. AC460]